LRRSAPSGPGLEPVGNGFQRGFLMRGEGGHEPLRRRAAQRLKRPQPNHSPVPIKRTSAARNCHALTRAGLGPSEGYTRGKAGLGVGRDVMKFGIFYELQLPRPWVEGDELRLYQNALTQLETADRVGYDYAWVVEHHFLEEYSHSPAPESFLAAASQRTRQIRLGHGIFQLTTNHPARVAERVAVLDLLSNGRCEFGMGES